MITERIVSWEHPVFLWKNNRGSNMHSQISAKRTAGAHSFGVDLKSIGAFMWYRPSRRSGLISRGDQKLKKARHQLSWGPQMRGSRIMQSWNQPGLVLLPATVPEIQYSYSTITQTNLC